MKRSLCAALAATLALCAGGLAETAYDFSDLSLEQLYQVRDELNALIDEKESAEPGRRYETGSYLVGRDLPEGDYVLVENRDAMFSGIVVKASEEEDAELVSYRLINRRAAIHLRRDTLVTLTDATAYPLGSAPAPELEEGVYPEGAYLVGLDVPAGDYTVAPVDKAPLSSYSVYSGILGTDARTLKFEVLRTEAACALHDGEYIELSGCTLRPAD